MFDMALQEAFAKACQNWDVEKVRELLQDPNLDPDYKLNSWTPFRNACIGPFRHLFQGEQMVIGEQQKKDCMEILSLLKRRAVCDPNEDVVGVTTLSAACFYEDLIPVVELLLADPRADVTKGYVPTYSIPLHLACQQLNLEAACRIAWVYLEKDLPFPGSLASEVRFRADQDRSPKKPIMDAFIALIDKGDKRKIRRFIDKTGILEMPAARLFAPVVLYSDDCLGLKKDTATTEEAKAKRFFEMVGRLPLEIQMLIVNRAVGSMKDLVPSKKLEIALREEVAAQEKPLGGEVVAASLQSGGGSSGRGK